MINRPWVLVLSVMMLLLPAVTKAQGGHKLTVTANPKMAATFNTNEAQLMADEIIHLQTYPNVNFDFIRWTDETGKVVSEEEGFPFVMPAHDVQLTAEYEYNPANPANPLRNYWDAMLGNLIVDDFLTGQLQGAAKAAIGDGKAADVLMITVSGVMNNNDFGIINTYSNCTLLDLSRVAGITQVPSYAFDYTNLESAYLPATIESIGTQAFAECKLLSSLTVYAMTPPELGNNVFKGVDEGLVVYVPAAAIARYQDADGWKEFTLLPIQEDIRSITVSLPDGASPQDYAQMWLELTNTKSGQRMHYVMTDRTQYIFANVIRNTSWNVTLRNERGDVFGQIDNIEVNEEDVSVTFAQLSKPQNVVLSVLTPDGKNVTEQTQITWMDASGNYMAQGVSLAGLPVGYQVRYRMALSQELAMVYNTPPAADYTLKGGGNNLICQLVPIQQVKITGKVKDATTGLPLSGAVVSASQTYGGKYSKTLNAKTDSKGVFTMDVLNVPTNVSFAATNYISQTISLDDGLDELNELNDVLLKPITGATITVDLTYTTIEGETQNWYSDYQNVSYTLFNISKNRAISQYNVQYPQIVLLEDIEDGDVLRLTAASRTNAFMPVESTATIAEQKATASFTIKELGKIEASFDKTGNAAVVGSLYDASGKLVKTYNYSNASLTISDLTDGQYTLVSMGSSRLFNTIYDLAQLPQTGLVEGIDYVQNKVEVKSGEVSPISISEVPTLDESKLYYTGENTSFTANKPSIVAGNYLTLTGHIDFKPAYAANVSNVQLIVDLPESCEFVEKSVMVGNSNINCTPNGNQITIPMSRYTDRVRFCIIPTLGGDYAPSAFVQFDLYGETIKQPIGSANYTAKDLSISIPSTVAKTSVPISGTAIGTSNVEIYDNGVLIGQTTSLANGTWATTCELNEPYNLSTHSIYAKVTTKVGLELQSEIVKCLYDKNAIEVKTVTMINTAHTAANLDLHDYVTVFDFQNPGKPIPAYWYWPSYPDFTFIVDFTNNDTTALDNVWLHIYTSSGDIHSLQSKYDSKLKKYIANNKFNSNTLPINVSVSYNSNVKPCMDRAKVNSLYEQTENFISESRNLEIKELIKKLSEAVYNENYDETLNFSSELYSILSLDAVAADTDSISMDSLFYEIDKILYDGLSGIDFKLHEGDTIYYDEISKTYISISYGKLSELNNTIDYSNFFVYDLDDNSVIYFYADELAVKLIDPKQNYYIMIERNDSVNRRRTVKRMPEWLSILNEYLNQFDNWTKIYKALVGDVAEGIARLKGLCDSKMENTMKELDACRRQMKFIEGKYKTGKLPKYYYKYRGKEAQLLSNLSKIKSVLKVISKVAIALNYWATFDDAVYAGESINEWISIIRNIESLDCPGMEELKEKAISSAILVGDGFVATLAADAAGLSNLKSSLKGGWTTAVELLISDFAISIGGITKIGDMNMKSAITNQIPTLKDCRIPPPYSPQPSTPPTNYILDPSGFVYEGISTNRIEGVTATAYYKEMVEDMYGDLHEKIVKWDAEEYAQENPLFTDEDGMYAWDVPQGLWQVKFEKEGYETTYSEWLPVPPPQLDVNIAMKQNVQPMIKLARAYEDAVEMEFDKYMMPELLTTENIMVMQDGKPVEGIVELLNEEVSYEGSNETFASKIRFNAAQPFTQQEITLMVSNRVKSYAGIRMQDDYQQTFAIEQEIKQIVSDSLAVVGYGEKATLTVSVLPASASKGKTLIVKTSSPMILSVETEQVVIGNDGKAEITASGELPGTAALTFSVEGTYKTAITIANVELTAYKTVASPTVNVASGTVVEKGTKIELSCTTEGATIYYTLDGSCPCEESDNRMVYDGTPIVINENVTIKVIAVAPNMNDSEIAEFTYIVDGTGITAETLDEQVQIYPLPVRDKLNVSATGKMIKSVIVTAMNGTTVAASNTAAKQITIDVSALPSGVYIVNVQTANSTFSRKVIKMK